MITARIGIVLFAASVGAASLEAQPANPSIPTFRGAADARERPGEPGGPIASPSGPPAQGLPGGPGRARPAPLDPHVLTTLVGPHADSLFATLGAWSTYVAGRARLEIPGGASSDFGSINGNPFGKLALPKDGEVEVILEAVDTDRVYAFDCDVTHYGMTGDTIEYVVTDAAKWETIDFGVGPRLLFQWHPPADHVDGAPMRFIIHGFSDGPTTGWVLSECRIYRWRR